MDHSRTLKRLSSLWLLGCILLGPATARAQQALYQQCPSLSESANAEVLKQIAALKDQNAQVRAQAAAALGKTCDQRVISPLIGLLKDADPQVRVAAVEALGRLGDRTAIEPLIELAEDPDWRVRQKLALALCSFQVYQASYVALNVLAVPRDGVKTEEEMRVKCTAILAVHQLTDVSFSRKAVSFLLTFLDDEREPMRKIAEQTMYELKNTRNGPHELVGILKQSNAPSFRRKAAYWIGKLGIERGRRALEDAAENDRDVGVRETAKEALALLNKNSSH